MQKLVPHASGAPGRGGAWQGGEHGPPHASPHMHVHGQRGDHVSNLGPDVGERVKRAVEGCRRWAALVPAVRAVVTGAGCGQRRWMSPKGDRSCKVAVNTELHRIREVLGHKIYAFFPGLFSQK